MATSTPPPPADPLARIDTGAHTFSLPTKRIHSAEDVSTFHSSLAHARITAFLQLLNASVTPISTDPPTPYKELETQSPSITVSPEVQGIINLVQELEGLVQDAPPEEGPRRFGNVAFRTWHKLAEEKVLRGDILERHLPGALYSKTAESGDAKAELASYLLGGFGSMQRLDYGTGHELSFLAFLGGIYLLDGFERGKDERALATKCMDAYLHLVRVLVKTYNLEPAGSHGVWGLDDHSFLPYIFGSAQLTTYPAGGEDAEAPLDIPRPTDIVKPKVVSEWRSKNLYFGAVGFINDVKTGPFWEHSPILYDVSGVKGGWGKINQGMLKMFSVEVLSKFPVVQHFYFGSLFPWPFPATDAESDPINTQPAHAPWAKPGSLPPVQSVLPPPPPRPAGIPGPSPTSSGGLPERFDAPAKPINWQPTRAPWATNPTPPSGGPRALAAANAVTKAPWANSNMPKPPPPTGGTGDSASGPIMTRAPWAK